MKGAGKKTQQSRLAKLHHLILQGNLVLGQFFSVAWRVACWLCLILQRPYRAIIQVGTFAGIVYLVWSSLSQTTVALNIVYSDAATGLENPITVQNKSDLFSVRNIVWKCHILDAEYERQIRLGDVGVTFNGNISVIEPGKALNISCQKRGEFQAIKIGEAKLLSAHITIDIDYDADFFGLWYYHRSVHTPFAWVGTIAQPQWVQWDFAH
jgi:hypothetical protein